MRIRRGEVILDPLGGTDYEVGLWHDGVSRGLTTNHLFTGSKPMRAIDVRAAWDRERAAGDILYGIWTADGGERALFVGTCGLHGLREIYRSWEARWLIFDVGAVGRGVGQDAVIGLTNYAFQRLNAHRVWLGVSEDNLRAVKCYLNCGYKLEGRLRDEIFYDGSYHSALRMSILEDEAPKLRETLWNKWKGIAQS